MTRSRTGLMGLGGTQEVYFHLESDFTRPSGGRDSLEDVYLRSPEKEEMLPRVCLEPQQADLPEVVQGSIHFSERLVSHNSAICFRHSCTGPIWSLWVSCDGISITYCVLVTGGQCVF